MNNRAEPAAALRVEPNTHQFSNQVLSEVTLWAAPAPKSFRHWITSFHFAQSKRVGNASYEGVSVSMEQPKTHERHNPQRDGPENFYGSLHVMPRMQGVLYSRQKGMFRCSLALKERKVMVQDVVGLMTGLGMQFYKFNEEQGSGCLFWQFQLLEGMVGKGWIGRVDLDKAYSRVKGLAEASVPPNDKTGRVPWPAVKGTFYTPLTSIKMAPVIVTGASGVLGSAVYAAFKSAGNTTLGLANSRPTEELKQLDLLDVEATERVFTEFRPDWVIHCAAERRPDVAEEDPEAARKLNVSVPEALAKLSKKLKFKLVYISTDYVFDGTSPPYAPSAATNPLNLYGISKRDGETAVLGVSGAQSIVLRVPILYGPAPNNNDSAVNILLDVVVDQTGKQYRMDHYATRFPTNVLDIADFLVRLTALPPSRTIPPILHYSAAEPFTKYEMCLIFAKILGVPHGHIIADAEAPQGGAPRPQNTQLYVHETEDLMEGFGGVGWNPFEEWWTGYLTKTQ